MPDRERRALTLLGSMEFPKELHTITSGWSFSYIEGPQVIILKNK